MSSHINFILPRCIWTYLIYALSAWVSLYFLGFPVLQLVLG